MKNKKILAALTAAVIFTITFVVVQSCQKTSDVREPVVSGLDDESTAVREHILAFKAKMEYYRQNPNLKSSGTSYTADSATIEIESLINFDFCYTNIECNQKTFATSQVIMPLDEYDSINDPNLMDVYYDKVIDTVQAQMGRVNYTNMKLLLVDLEVSGYESNGDAIIKVGSLIGNEQNIVFHNDNWWYGRNLGLCGSQQYAPEDGASQLEARVIDNVLPDPPAGGRWHFTNPVPTTIDPTQDPLDETPDNYLDYKVFYATEAVGTIDFDVKCMSIYEMSFYKNHYIDYAQGCETTDLKFADCLIEGKQYTDDYFYIQHEYTIWVGYRFVEYTITVGDILAVE